MGRRRNIVYGNDRTNYSQRGGKELDLVTRLVVQEATTGNPQEANRHDRRAMPQLKRKQLRKPR